MGKPQQLARKFELVSGGTLELCKEFCYGADVISCAGLVDWVYVLCHGVRLIHNS